ncbi:MULTISPECIES: hypothetical protein [Rhizobium/Agrobacterium group]|uniref:hypothetical protein n=1 Tax=Rhizobium/Agrobacterium group TaxID=227290 RepID=UPI000BDB0793|nr:MULTISPECIES: hypothetical protein [Rhizobium/Agrobacterium group]AYM61234.1 hypothetical protein At12D13_00690 [Agrobacterium fabrum]MDH7806746.1 rubrerythrin [Rhizobium sp. AN67]MDQ4408041.1 hypothetical protein [Rhizobium sp. AN63]NTE59336.1 hypothetical protein [Agrobacterium fabrum]SOD57862.1 hypothetical protein SAMN05216595_3921 [Rhizobium sp. AN6A]
MTKPQSLDLLNNSISYFREAVSYAQKDTSDANQWKFAILHVVQAMELAFKERLRKVHPVFIYENIDKPDKTISLRVAISRLNNPSIGNLPISDEDKRKIEKAFELRSQLTHFEFKQSPEHIELKFAEIFSFMIFFYRTQLGLPTSEFIDEEQHSNVIRLIKTRQELLRRAKDYIENLEDDTRWICPECNETTFIVAEEQCCFCHRKEPIIECPTCGSDAFEHDLIDISDAFDWSSDEGRVEVQSYGMETITCPDCVYDARETAEQIRRYQYDEDIAMEEYYHNKAK